MFLRSAKTAFCPNRVGELPPYLSVAEEVSVRWNLNDAEVLRLDLW
jgi:hypothetical protein